ncbi:uncharacterized protein LOC110006636 isoform X2 [Amborella trichopoda]|uniref:uncharacterized protein LOC110006636 isoform X2 n=1 Tax=Amborella trichopoda TaxID=13333 RepID=UPI0009BF68A2|nr:uncharacterized protein LOC110006636 isoform X2 [Amborella trichopoda]|eukprot:XP_020518423.1 uncharacterized protein LOC110006636 isoform X2 [Amborella trichopoda]
MSIVVVVVTHQVEVIIAVMPLNLYEHGQRDDQPLKELKLGLRDESTKKGNAQFAMVVDVTKGTTFRTFVIVLRTKHVVHFGSIRWQQKSIRYEFLEVLRTKHVVHFGSIRWQQKSRRYEFVEDFVPQKVKVVNANPLVET